MCDSYFFALCILINKHRVELCADFGKRKKEKPNISSPEGGLFKAFPSAMLLFAKSAQTFPL